jgi:hypothetical protein
VLQSFSAAVKAKTLTGRDQVLILDTFGFWSAPLTFNLKPFLPFPIKFPQINVRHFPD